MTEEVFQRIDETWRKTAHNKSPDSTFNDVGLINQMFGLFSSGIFFYTVFSPNNMEMEYCSPTVETCLGYSASEMNTVLFRDCIHPDDIQGLLIFEKEIGRFYRSLPIEKIKNYKTRYSFRLKKANGDYARFQYQALPYEIDAEGAILRLVAVFTDIGYLKNDHKMALSFIGINGEPDILNVQTFKPSTILNNPLTKREVEVLTLISSNVSTSNIAQKLNICSVTVINHRKKMLQKTGVGSTLKLVLLAKEKEWIS